MLGWLGGCIASSLRCWLGGCSALLLLPSSSSSKVCSFAFGRKPSSAGSSSLFFLSASGAVRIEAMSSSKRWKRFGLKSRILSRTPSSSWRPSEHLLARPGFVWRELHKQTD